MVPAVKADKTLKIAYNLALTAISDLLGCGPDQKIGIKTYFLRKSMSEICSLVH
jgi:hypothetical protein